MSGQPLVSCICPTYNRRRFLPYLIHMFETQEWPKDKKELIILDDSPTSNQDIIDQHKKDLNIKYIYSSERIHLGEKRNRLNNMANGEYIFCFDDDDYYPPQRLKVGVSRMRSSKKTLSGSSILYTYYTNLNKLVIFGPYGPKHCTNGTMAYHRSFVKDHYYEKDATKAEEKFFLKDYSADMVQINPLDVMICISHGENTVDKRRIMNTGKDTEIKIKTLIKDKKLLQFYNSLVEEAKNLPELEKPKMKFIETNNLDLENVENGFILIQKEIIEEKLKEAIRNKAPIPILNRFEKILKKMEKGEIRVLTDPNKKLYLNEVLEGKVKLSKDYVEIWTERMKMQNAPEHIITIMKNIRELQENGALKYEEVTPINEYNQILLPDIFNQNSINNNTNNSNNINNNSNDNYNKTLITDIIDGNVKVSKEYVTYWLEKAKLTNITELINQLDTIKVLQDNDILEYEESTPFDKYEIFVSKNNVNIENNNSKNNLVLEDVINGKVKLSKEYVDHLLNKITDTEIIKELEIIKNLQDNDVIEKSDFTPFNNYDEIFLTHDNVPKMDDTNKYLILKDIIDEKVIVSKDYIKHWKNEILTNNGPKPVLNELEVIEVLQNNDILKYEEYTPLDKYEHIILTEKDREIIEKNNLVKNEKQDLSLSDVLNKRVSVSKNYIEYWLNNMKQYNGNENMIKCMEEIKKLQDNNLLEHNNFTPLDKYKNIILN